MDRQRRERLAPSGAEGPGHGPSTSEPEEAYDLIVVGAGLAGLATAFFATRANPGQSVLLLEQDSIPGGMASRDDRLDVPAQAAGAYIVYPYADFLRTFYKGIDVDPDRYVVAAPFFSYHFDSAHGPAATRGAMPDGTRRWVFDVLSPQGIAGLPFTPKVRDQFEQVRGILSDWLGRAGAPTDPPEATDPRYDTLSFRSFRDYLTLDLGLDQVVAEFFDQYTSDCMGAATADVNAHTAIGHLAAELEPRCAFPGGNSYLARKALSTLIPGSVSSDGGNGPIIRAHALDDPANRVRCRTNARAVALDDRGDRVIVDYEALGRRSSVAARAVVLATGIPAARRFTRHLMTDEQWRAARTYRVASTVVANVAVRDSAFLVEAGCGYDHYWYGGRHWQDFIVADWPLVGNDPATREDPTRPNVLTVYGTALTSSGETNWEAHADDASALRTPFEDYERSLREDLARTLGDAGFDFDRDVRAIHLHRLPAALIIPVVGWLFGSPPAGGPVTRASGPRSEARQRIGRISFAGADTEGSPSVESAIASGLRAADEAAELL